MLACLTAEKGLRALVAVVFIKKNIVTENTEEDEKKDAISKEQADCTLPH